MTAIIINIDDYRRKKQVHDDNDFDNAIKLVGNIIWEDEHTEAAVGAPTGVDIMPAWNVIMTAATNRNHGYRLSRIRHCVNMVNAYLERNIGK